MVINKKEFKKNVQDYLKTFYRRTVEDASQQQIYSAVAFAVKDYIVDRWAASQKEFEKKDAKTVYYLSMEFLMGRALGNTVINLKADKEIRKALEELGLDLDAIEDQEPDAALGKGRLPGRASG